MENFYFFLLAHLRRASKCTAIQKKNFFLLQAEMILSELFFVAVTMAQTIERLYLWCVHTQVEPLFCYHLKNKILFFAWCVCARLLFPIVKARQQYLQEKEHKLAALSRNSSCSRIYVQMQRAREKAAQVFTFSGGRAASNEI